MKMQTVAAILGLALILFILLEVFEAPGVAPSCATPVPVHSSLLPVNLAGVGVRKPTLS
jgi:hypothetical protein